jgi:hypothetical protein
MTVGNMRAIVDEPDICKARVFELLRGLLVGAERAPFRFDHADEQTNATEPRLCTRATSGAYAVGISIEVNICHSG